MAVDDFGRLYYDPAFLEERDVGHRAFVVLHEVIHVWGRHAKRCVRLLGERPPQDKLKLWRLAVDASVNDILEQSGLKCPEEGITPAKLGLPRNKTPEQYFRLLFERQQAARGEGREERDKGDESADKEPGRGAGEPGRGESGEEAQPLGPSPQSLVPASGGSSCDGQPRPWECGPPSDQCPGMAEHEQNLLQAAVAKAIEEHEKQHGKGSVPGGLAREASNPLHPKVDPARELLAKVKYAVACTSGFGNFTYRKPNRRQPQGGALLPAHVKPVPRVTVIADTSGSMEKSDLTLALGVIGNALRSLPDPRGLRVLAGDTAVACAKNVFRPEQVELAGGGGTDMAAMIVAAAEERPAPKAILVVTDGYTGWPHEPVGPHVMACLTRADTARGVPEWIHTVILNPEE
jgi:predicted metal-dependent peptidase